MVKRHNRLLAAFFVCPDAALGMVAFVLAHYVRFHSGLIPVTKGYPPLLSTWTFFPSWPCWFPGLSPQGLYRLAAGPKRRRRFLRRLHRQRRGGRPGRREHAASSRRIYVPAELKDRGAYEVSQLAWALFLVCNVALTCGSRAVVREVLERRWRAGVGLKRIVIAGAGELGGLVAEKILQHRELGYQIVGFLDDRAGGDHLGYRGLPLLGTLADAAEVVQRERIDHLYVALPLDEHVKMLNLIESTSREMVDVKVVPDLLQFLALRARLEDLDGVPIVSIHDVPLQGLNTVIKRVIDITLSAAALVVLAVPFALIALMIRLTSPGGIFYRQERMGLDGRAFTVYKFRSMWSDAERDMPIWARDDDPRCTPFGRFLRRFDLDELPQFWNVLRGDMSLVGPRPERPFFVDQFKHRFPQYMLRHKVKAGITGWAQVNGWRGDTSIEKRIEFDLY